jgi:hypothetical protein
MLQRKTVVVTRSRPGSLWRSNGYVYCQLTPRTGAGDSLRPGWGEGELGKEFGTVAEAGVMQWISVQVAARGFARTNGRFFEELRIGLSLLFRRDARRRIDKN